MGMFGAVRATAILALLLLPYTSAQPTSRPTFDAFEVATVKLSNSEAAAGRYIRMQSTNRFVARNCPLKVLISGAYNLSPQAISGGPSWIDSDRYEILAQSPGNVRPTLDEQMKMLRKLLQERFNLTFHRATKELAVYALTIAKNGPRLKDTTLSPDASPEGPPPLVFVISPGAGRLPGRYATTAELASVLQRAALDRPVVDQTGLTGRYDFDLEFSTDESIFGGALPKGNDQTKPNLFTALQEQLGLKLEARKGPVDTLVIETISRPSEN
jgi:uncharacterized protein (TIGR03435 family)